MGAAVVACVDAPPVLEFAEHILDLVAALVEFLVEDVLDLSVSLWWYAGIDVPGGQRLAELQLKVAFEQLFARLPNLRPVGEPRRLRSNFINGIKTLAVDF